MARQLASVFSLRRQARLATDSAQADLAPLDVEARSENALESGMDLGEQAANAVASLGDLVGEIVIEVAQHGEFGELLIGH